MNAMTNLVMLAQKLIDLTHDLDATRAAMKRLLLNGEGEKTDLPFARPKAKPPPRSAMNSHHDANGAKPVKAHAAKTQPTREQTMLTAAKAEEKIVVLLRSTPGMKTIDVARKVGQPPTSTQNRLTRLQHRGLVSRDAERWSASGGLS
jgi:predicted Rossmann fold nucleotide-binding protein DprA/Smf involved in DNA uptake